MRQTVTIHRVADRHESPHERAYAETHSRTVPAGSLAAVLHSIAHGLVLPRGRYVIEVDWPHEDGSTPASGGTP